MSSILLKNDVELALRRPHCGFITNPGMMPFRIANVKAEVCLRYQFLAHSLKTISRMHPSVETRQVEKGK